MNKYAREIKPGVFVDVYDVLKAFNVTCPAMAHAVKKALAPGQRGHKDTLQDMREVIQSVERAIELEGGDIVPNKPTPPPPPPMPAKRVLAEDVTINTLGKALVTLYGHVDTPRKHIKLLGRTFRVIKNKQNSSSDVTEIELEQVE